MKILPGVAGICILLALSSSRGVSGLEYSQKNYHIVHDRVIVERQLDSWVHVRVTNGKFNRTQRTFTLQFTLLRDLHPTKVMAKVEVYRFAGNAYKPFTPLNVHLNMCELLKKTTFGIQALKTTHGNVTDCPHKKGIIMVWDWAPEEEKYPPFIPEGKYRVVFECLSDTTSLWTLSWYCSIVSRRQH